MGGNFLDIASSATIQAIAGNDELYKVRATYM